MPISLSPLPPRLEGEGQGGGVDDHRVGEVASAADSHLFHNCAAAFLDDGKIAALHSLGDGIRR